MHYLGLGKTLFNSSACLITKDEPRFQIELVLSERVNRNKASGVWPAQAIQLLLPRIGTNQPQIAENRDVLTPLQREEILNKTFPFYDHLESQGLLFFSSRNPEMRFLTHHLCHAMAALAMSPFQKSLIVVLDGAGSRAADFPQDHRERLEHAAPAPESLEACSVYTQDEGKIRCVRKIWQTFAKSERNEPHYFSEGIGTLYEKTAEFIFNCNRSSGKVMGLAALGTPSPISDRRAFLENLPWEFRFKGKGKAEWESCGSLALFADIAASVQNHFEQSVLSIVQEARDRFPDYENLILTGGCALNCTTNMKIVQTGLFREVYVPPFPGDESIGFGAASALYHSDPKNDWEPFPHESQNGYFGSKTSVPEISELENLFSGFKITRPRSITDHCADLLTQNKIIAWFQGRSESGPRALGNRSILVRPDYPGIKDHLNRIIKFRESFRPYGCSCVHEVAHDYFEVPAGFDGPYMSFASKTRADFREKLKEVTHVDGTSRMQTVRQTQNPLFYELIRSFGEKTGLFCLLNTSLNVMGEPIVETALDARRFLEKTQVDGLAIGDYFIEKVADA